ncbi:MAG: ATPase [Bdellovibrionales bacterium RIFOXYB1_FULL_37_110]|nr:MAG: ATPase [Bdellovibrionales bacterium RIFOXYC1_FULL_37_79]OFZ57306.1 MAG: ATPase [Bdellovibrionales bacterium RIFOXYB1_FULL_37_110]OFZ62202.1 MAG: ATPase [Bdellovibrionales bacterium RIFOXYD1_FULL_36_51]
MKIAVPVANQLLCMHFGHCEVFAFFEVDEAKKIIKSCTEVTPPAHEPGILPQWVKKQGADLVLAGGMGQRAQELFNQNGVHVVVGVTENNPAKAVLDYLKGNLITGTNACDH